MNESCRKIIFITITNLSYLELANVPLREVGVEWEEFAQKNFEIYVHFYCSRLILFTSLVQFLTHAVFRWALYYCLMNLVNLKLRSIF